MDGDGPDGEAARQTPARPVVVALDATFYLAVLAERQVERTARTVVRVTRPVAGLMLRPPLVREEHWPQTLILRLAEHGRQDRERWRQQAETLVLDLVPPVLDAVLSRIDLTSLVLDKLDIAQVVDALDINAIVERVDIEAIIDRVPIDEVVRRIDIDAIVASVDIDAIVARIDMDAIVGRIDLNQIAARLDLNELATRLDLNAIAARIDIEAIIGRLDLAAITSQVIEEIDLPEIIRESSGAMASETVLGVRMRGIEADERVNRLVDRLMLRRRSHPSDQQQNPNQNGTHP